VSLLPLTNSLCTGRGALGAAGDMPALGVFALVALRAQYLAVEQAAVGAVATVVVEICTGAAAFAAVGGSQQGLLFHGGGEFGAADHVPSTVDRAQKALPCHSGGHPCVKSLRA
jgi:hypothetical protein